jgi:hypothetical protein
LTGGRPPHKAPSSYAAGTGLNTHPASMLDGLSISEKLDNHHKRMIIDVDEARKSEMLDKYLLKHPPLQP